MNRGESILQPTIASRVMSRVSELSRHSPTPDALSERELDVLKLMVTGLSNREIGDELFISHNTVKTHIVSLFGKLGVSSRAEAVARALERGLVRR